MKCVLYLDDPKSEFAECEPNDCDRLGCKLNSNYDKREEIKDVDFAKPGRYGISTIIQILMFTFIMFIPIPYVIFEYGLTVFTIVISMFCSGSLYFFYYEILYKTNKYWNENYEKIRTEIERRLSDSKETC